MGDEVWGDGCGAGGVVGALTVGVDEEVEGECFAGREREGGVGVVIVRGSDGGGDELCARAEGLALEERVEALARKRPGGRGGVPGGGALAEVEGECVDALRAGREQRVGGKDGFEQRGGGGRDVLAADLRAWEGRALDQRDVKAGAGEVIRRGGPGGAGADNGDGVWAKSVDRSDGPEQSDHRVRTGGFSPAMVKRCVSGRQEYAA